MRTADSKTRTHRRASGLSLVELLIALAISAMLMAATMVAIDASFKAYAAAAETASTQTATRMVVNRALTLLRTSTAHGPLTLGEAQAVDSAATLSGDTITSNYIDLIDTQGRYLRIQYDATDETINLLYDENGDFDFDDVAAGDDKSVPLLGGVTAANFHTLRREDAYGVLVLERGAMDFTVEPDADATLAIESEDSPPIRVIASTMPRRIEN